MKFNEAGAVLNGAKGYIRDLSMFEGMYPYQFTTPRHEVLGCRETAWIGCYLTMMGRYDLIGSDAVKMLNYVCVNRDFANLKIGGSRHALICDENGNMVSTGVITRLSEEHFQTYCMYGLIGYAMSGQWDVKIEKVDEFFFQVDGPKSLQIMEKAFQCDFHDLKFGRNKKITINGCELLVHRLGMSGALTYEMHGKPEFADMIYERLVKAGEEFDARQLGTRQYCAYNHTPGGYPNMIIHFINPPETNPNARKSDLSGSCADNPNNYYCDPYTVGWGNLVNFDHDFVGKEALQRIVAEQKKTVTTLVWNLDDVGKVFAAQISDPELAAQEGIHEYSEFQPECVRAHADKVLLDGKQIGMTSGRTIDFYTNTFVSLAFMDKEYATEGAELEILWGKPGTKQMNIRATVAQFPYYNGEFRNETFDVEKIPRQF